jgi:hypothetical protein
MRHPELGITKKGFYGFSLTTLCFASFPALFRADFLTFFVGLGISILVAVAVRSAHVSTTISYFLIYLPWLIWAFMYNRFYTCRLLERGYVFYDAPETVEKACRVLNIKAPEET